MGLRWCGLLVLVSGRGFSRFDCENALVMFVFFGVRVCGSFHAFWAKLSNAIRSGPIGQCGTHSKNVCVLIGAILVQAFLVQGLEWQFRVEMC